ASVLISSWTPSIARLKKWLLRFWSGYRKLLIKGADDTRHFCLIRHAYSFADLSLRVRHNGRQPSQRLHLPHSDGEESLLAGFSMRQLLAGDSLVRQHPAR